jgi:hypothetical protein
MLAPLHPVVEIADMTFFSAVKTAEGNKAAQFFGFEEAFTEVHEAVDGIVGRVSSLVLMTLLDCLY